MTYDLELSPLEEGLKEYTIGDIAKIEARVDNIMKNVKLAELTPFPQEEEYKPPPYGVPGRILFEIFPDNAETERVEVIDYDPETSLFWLNEGLGFDWFFENCTDYIEKLGGDRYIMTVNGYYYKGLSWRESLEPTDDDEEWEIVEEAKKTDLESLL